MASSPRNAGIRDASAKARRIDICITELKVGGAERCVCELALGLHDRGWRVRVISIARRPTGPQAILVERMSRGGVAVEFLGVNSKWRVWAAAARLARLIKQDPPHVAQGMLFHANVLTMLLVPRYGVPCIFTGQRVVERDHPWRMVISRLLRSRVTRHICVSESVAEDCRHRGLASEKTLVIPNGIDTARFDLHSAGDERPGETNHGRLVWIGRLAPQKQPVEMIQAIAPLIERGACQELLIAGDGPLADQCRDQIATIGLGEKIQLLSWRSDTDALIQSADVVLSSSAWEGMPNSILEAMAAAKPVVAFDVEGVSQILGPSASDQTVAPNDWSGLVRRIKELLADAALRDRLGKANRSRAEEQFSITRMIDAYEATYREALGDAKASS